MVVLAGGLLALAPGNAWAAGNVSAGEREYMANCATCHGPTGLGDGPMADPTENILTKKPSNLTMLSKNNGGTFPTEKVRNMIDGRAMVAAHGNRDMPVWGYEYGAQAAEYYRHLGITDTEAFINDRIDDLVAYLQSIQQ
jgi:mono/diheme cytochrome c family protein